MSSWPELSIHTLYPRLTQPQSGHFLHAGQDIRVLRLPQTAVQSGDKHGIRRRQVNRVAASFQTEHAIFLDYIYLSLDQKNYLNILALWKT